MTDKTWMRYCEALEELRRQQDSRRRKGSAAGVEVIDKVGSISAAVPVPATGSALGADEDNAAVTGSPPPSP